MKQAANAIALCLLLAVCAQMPGARAEPYETNPDAATRDPDYAAGKAAIEAKN